MFKIVKGDGMDSAYITDRLVEYNLSRVPLRQPEAFVDIVRKAVDGDGNTVGGCIAEIYCWNVMYVDILWVDESARGQGLGTRLLGEVEEIARARGCTLVHLDTFDFQAKDFYLRHGYRLFGVLEGCPEGHCRYYLSKNLAGLSPAPGCCRA